MSAMGLRNLKGDGGAASIVKPTEAHEVILIFTHPIHYRHQKISS